MTYATMYSRRGCVVCREARALLEEKGATVSEIVIDGATVTVTGMSDVSDRRGLPQIFIGKTHVGGLESLKSLNDTGKLEWLLKYPKP
jgi:glutaredoxin 3